MHSINYTLSYIQQQRFHLGDCWTHYLANGLAKSTSLTTLHFAINDIELRKCGEKSLVKGLATLRESLITLTVKVNHRNVMGETSGSDDPSDSPQSTPSATPTLSSAARITSKFFSDCSSLTSHHLTNIENVTSEYAGIYPARLRKSLPALSHAVNYPDPMDQVIADRFERMLSTAQLYDQQPN